MPSRRAGVALIEMIDILRLLSLGFRRRLGMYSNSMTEARPGTRTDGYGDRLFACGAYERATPVALMSFFQSAIDVAAVLKRRGSGALTGANFPGHSQ